VVLKFVKRFVSDTEAATAVEYAVILMLIGGALIATLQSLGGSASAFWSFIGDQTQQALDQQGF
jgi:Flp pilus assembly pilin Flp